MILFVLLLSPMLHLDLEKCVNYSCLVRLMSLYCPVWKENTQLLHSPATGQWQFLKDLFTISEPDQDLIYVEFGVEPNHFLQLSRKILEELSGGFTLCQWRSSVNLHMQKFDEDSGTPCPNCPFKLKLERLCHTMSYYVMLLTSTSVAEVSPLKQQSKNEVLLHRVRTPWVRKFQCRTVHAWLPDFVWGPNATKYARLHHRLARKQSCGQNGPSASGGR